MTQTGSYNLREETWRRGRNVMLLLTVSGWVAAGAGYAGDPKRFFASYLAAFLYFITVCLGALFFVMMQHLTGSVWSVTMRRLAENVMATLPAGALLFVPVAAGLPHLYAWMHAEAAAADPVLAGKAGYLNGPFFLIRAAMYFGIWSLVAWRLHRLSVRQDESHSVEPIRAARRWSAPGLVLLMVTGTLAAFDWIMSLEPHWYSTIFGVYVLAGGTLAFMALLTLVALGLRRADVLREAIHGEHYHDLGKWLLALTIFWAYIAFSQYLLIWYANLPEETVWYRHRFEGSWLWASAALVAGRFLVPFNVLLPLASKRKLAVLGAMAGWILATHYLDIYWLVMPVFQPHGVSVDWLDAATLAAVGGTLALVFWSKLRKHATAPVGDLRFERALQFENS